ncbi:MAG: HEAT repeat domain-containing protein [Candidatus Diapherotrites archaeon]
MLSRKKKCNRLREQRVQARKEIMAIGIKPPPSTFPRQFVPSDHALRKLQKARVNVKALQAMLESSDPVIRKTALERALTDKRILKCLNPQTLEKLSRDPEWRTSSIALNTLAEVHARKGNLPELERMARDPEWRVREATARALGLMGEKALPELERLARDSHSFVCRQAINSIAQIREKKEKLFELSRDSSEMVRQQSAISMAKLGKKALPELERLARDGSLLVREAATNSIIQILASQGKIQELERIARNPPQFSDRAPWIAASEIARIHLKNENLSELERMAKDPNPFLSKTGTNALIEFHAKKGNLQELKKIAKGLKASFREKIARELVKIGEKAIPELEQLARDSHPFVAQAAAKSLIEILEKKRKTPKIEKLAKSENPAISIEAQKALARQKKTRWLLLATRKPFAATTHLKEILERTSTLKNIASQLKQEFGEQFTGITVFGSTSKGYAQPTSDIDYAIIATNPKAAQRFQEIARQKKLPLCKEHIHVNPTNTGDKNTAFLFCGLFFGDRTALKTAQKNAFEKMTPWQWNEIREEIHKKETFLEKAFERHQISEKQKQRLKAAAALRTPPPHQEMKKQLGIK